MIDINYILDKIPNYTEYLSVDELNKSSDALAKETRSETKTKQKST